MIVCRLIFTYKQYTKDITIMKGVQMEARSNMNKKLTPDFELQPSKIPCETFQVVKRLLRETMIEKQNIVKISRASGFFINPSTVKISIWNFIVIFTAYFLEFEISLTLAFGPQFWQTQIVQSVYLYWYILLLLLLLIDILVNFNKGFYAFGQGTIIDDKKEIIKKYIGSYFILDSICFGILLIPLIYNELILNYLQLVPVILLIIKKFKCQAEITRNLQYHYMGRVVFTLGMLGCDVLLLGNFGACIFLGIDLLLWKLQYFQSNPQYFWLSNNSMTSNNLMEPPFNSRIVQYVYAQCYSTGTLSTLAPGPFGKNVIEISLQLFIMTYFMILASYVAEVLILTFYSKQMVRIFHDNNINKFDHFLALKGVLFETKKRIHGFFQLIWEYQVKNQTTLQKAAINKLPLTIRQTLLYQMCFANQLKFPRIYSLEIEREIQKIVSFKIKTYIVDPDTTLFQNGTLTDSQGEAFIYNVKNGLAKYYLPFGKKNKTICLSNLRKIMGQYEFMTGLSHAYCAKSIDLSVVQKISFSDLNAILKSFNLQEQYFIVRFRIMLYNEVDLIERRCLICNEKHRQNCCTLIYPHYQIEQKFNKKQKKLEEQQERSPYERNQKYFRPRIPSKVESELHKITMKKIKIISSHKVNRQNLNKISDRVNIFQKFYTQYNLID